jgi:hypothetical protein
MTTKPVQVVFRNMSVSATLEDEVRSRASWLESFYPGVVGCRVVLQIPHRHRKRGRPLHVRIELSLPGEDVAINHEPALDLSDRSASHKSDETDGRHKDARVAIHEAFDIARAARTGPATRQPVGCGLFHCERKDFSQTGCAQPESRGTMALTPAFLGMVRSVLRHDRGTRPAPIRV